MDWQEKIIADYRGQFPTHFSFECSQGWADLLREMCRRTDLALDDEWREVFQWSQIKEKYGSLRAYNNGPDLVDEIVDWAEAVSEVTCEVCGNAGRLHKKGWLAVRCEEHTPKD